MDKSIELVEHCHSRMKDEHCFQRWKISFSTYERGMIQGRFFLNLPIVESLYPYVQDEVSVSIDVYVNSADWGEVVLGERLEAAFSIVEANFVTPVTKTKE